MERIGKYEIIAEIGRGGMGTVYQAHDPVIGREVAIKLILERAFEDPQVRERFYREARSAGRLSHENITILYDVGEESGRPYLVMEYLTGSDLRKRMRTDKLSIQQKIEIALQVARGLSYAHQHGIVHRDVKPDNIQVLDNGRVKIMDFGIARLGADTGTLTQTNTSIGTPRYMSPEQVRGAKVDGRSDIFSFGVVLYELLTGINPFEGEHITAVIYKILHAEPEPIRLEYGRLSDTVQQIVSKCLAKNPDQRYQSLDEVVRDLTALTTRHDVTLSRSAEAYEETTASPAKQDRRTETPVLLPILLLLIVGVLGAIGYVAFGPSRGDDAPSTPGLTTASPDTQGLPPSTGTDSAADGIEGTLTSDEDDPVDPTPPEDDPPEVVDPTPTETTTPVVRPDPARAAADVQREAMELAREKVADRRTETPVAALWRRAAEHERDGLRQYAANNAAAATRSFKSATDLYAEAASVLAEADREAATRTAAPPPQPSSTGNPATAERARTEMETAKRGVASAQMASTSYQEALRLEQQGRQAYENRTYDEAARLFGQALQRFTAAAAVLTPEERAARGVARLAGRLKQGFEAEDIDALGSISPFYQDWGRFFQVAEEVTADVQPGAVRAEGDRFLVDVRIRLDYLDNKDRRQSNSFTHAWSVAPRGDDWVVTAVLAR